MRTPLKGFVRAAPEAYADAALGALPQADELPMAAVSQ